MSRLTATPRKSRADAGLKRMFDRFASEPVPATILSLVSQLEEPCRPAAARHVDA